MTKEEQVIRLLESALVLDNAENKDIWIAWALEVLRDE